MADNRQMNDIYATIGAELIASEDVLIDIRNSQATIVYLESDYGKIRLTDYAKGLVPRHYRIEDFK